MDQDWKDNEMITNNKILTLGMFFYLYTTSALAGAGSGGGLPPFITAGQSIHYRCHAERFVRIQDFKDKLPREKRNQKIRFISNFELKVGRGEVVQQGFIYAHPGQGQTWKVAPESPVDTVLDLIDMPSVLPYFYNEKSVNDYMSNRATGQVNIILMDANYAAYKGNQARAEILFPQHDGMSRASSKIEIGKDFELSVEVDKADPNNWQDGRIELSQSMEIHCRFIR